MAATGNCVRKSVRTRESWNWEWEWEGNREGEDKKKGILTAGVGNATQMKQRQLQGNWFRHKVNGTVKRKKRKEEKRRKMDGQGK